MSAPAYKAHQQKGLLLNANEASGMPDASLMEEICERIASLPINRYPVDDMQELKEAYGNVQNIDPDKILCGNGSDQMLQLMITAKAGPDKTILTLTPDFGMYDFYAACLHSKIEKLPLSLSKGWKAADMIQAAGQVQPSLILFSNPNNPSGFEISREEIISLLDALPDIPVLVDEAYMEFGTQSVLDLVDVYPNLYVTRTLSKAWGLAGARTGFLVSKKENIQELENYRIVYSISRLDEAAALTALDHPELMEANVKRVLSERERMQNALSRYNWLDAHPSGANFICIETKQLENLKQAFQEAGIAIREFNDKVRLTIGLPSENDQVLQVLDSMERRFS